MSSSTYLRALGLAFHALNSINQAIYDVFAQFTHGLIPALVQKVELPTSDGTLKCGTQA